MKEQKIKEGDTDLINVAKDCRCVINLHDVLDDTYESSWYIRIFLIYKYGNSIGKRILFNDLDFEIKGE